MSPQKQKKQVIYICPHCGYKTIDGSIRVCPDCQSNPGITSPLISERVAMATINWLARNNLDTGFGYTQASKLLKFLGYEPPEEGSITWTRGEDRYDL